MILDLQKQACFHPVFDGFWDHFELVSATFWQQIA